MYVFIYLLFMCFWLIHLALEKHTNQCFLLVLNWLFSAIFQTCPINTSSFTCSITPLFRAMNKKSDSQHCYGMQVGLQNMELSALFLPWAQQNKYEVFKGSSGLFSLTSKSSVNTLYCHISENPPLVKRLYPWTQC